MPYSRESLYLRWVGHFGASLDGWSTGIRLAVIGGGPINASDYTGFLNTISSACQAFHISSNTYAGVGCYLDRITAAHLGLDGKYISDAHTTQEYVWGTAPNGVGTQTQPWSAAHVISLRTQFARGTASNGRFYYPALSVTTDPSTGRLQSGTVSNRVNGCKTMFDAINAAAQTLEPGLRIHVMSKVGPGNSVVCNALRADRRIDSIERRENQQPPTWTTVNLA